SLAGAAYRLYAAEDILHQDGTTGVLCAKDAEVKVRFVSSGVGIRTYRYDTGGTAVMKTAAGAELAVEGLEIGRYYLKEETASEGYLVD
ncbi:SpaA isopeptide-forming pilin-related protein, partial [Escherichia coli]|uniref:SpaA isopeptide-forming pilin-related protein n=1 Tax=Escherichia coli TaxID=562 RepID=UPI0028DE7C52